MKHYKDSNGNLHGFELDGSQDFLITEDMIEISLEESKAISQAKEDKFKQSLEYKINEAKNYLLSTDYKMTVDYFATLSKEIQDELILKRTEVREFIRANI